MPEKGMPMLSRMPAISSLRHDLADGLLHLLDEAHGFLDARAAARAQMQAELAAIHLREEILPELRDEQQRAEAEREEDRGEQPGDARGRISSSAR